LFAPGLFYTRGGNKLSKHYTMEYLGFPGCNVLQVGPLLPPPICTKTWPNFSFVFAGIFTKYNLLRAILQICKVRCLQSTHIQIMSVFDFVDGQVTWWGMFFLCPNSRAQEQYNPLMPFSNTWEAMIFFLDKLCGFLDEIFGTFRRFF
jgi:hypothetical protein